MDKSYYEEDLIGDKHVAEEELIGSVRTTGHLMQRTALARALELAREFIKDYNLGAACLRLDMPEEVGSRMYNSPAFAKAYRQCVEIIKPEDIISSREVLQEYKRIAFDPTAPHSARITALDKLNRFVTGMKPKDGLDDQGNMKNATPVVNITLTSNNGTDPRPKTALPAEPSVSV